MPAPPHSLLGLACSATLSDSRAALMRAQVSGIDNWAPVMRMATEHRLAPLLYWHLREYGIDVPSDVRRALAAAYARQKTIAAAQAATLAELGATLERAGIAIVVLKGGALAQLIYAEPGLRPMEDLDLLVAPHHGEAARKVLRDCGFNAPARHSRYDHLQHHDPIAHRTRDGITISVEVHTQAFNLIMGNSMSMENLQHPLTTFDIAGQGMYTLAPQQMLWMQYLGLRKLAEPMRFIHLADLAGIAGCFCTQIDWPGLRRQRPDMWHAFEVIHAFTPLAEPVCTALGLDPKRVTRMADVGLDYHGWPRMRSDVTPVRRRIRDTLLPPEWWARLVYGVNPARAYAWLVLRHAATFAQQGVRRLYLGPVTTTSFFKPPG